MHLPPISQTFRSISFAALAVGILVSAANLKAQSIFFAGTNANWTGDVWTSTNSTPPQIGLQPGTGSQIRMSNGAARTLILDSEVSVSNLFLAGNNNNTFTMNSGAILNLSASSQIGAGSNGFTYNLNSGASLVQTFGSLQFSSGASLTTVNHNGGLIDQSGSVRLAPDVSSSLNYNFASGEIRVGGDFGNAGDLGAVTFNWTGGSLRADGSPLASIHNAGTGTLNIGGTGAVDAGFTMSAANATYTQASTAFMAIDLASDASYDFLTLTGSDSDAILGGTISLNLIGSYIPEVGQTFDIVRATGGITDNGFVLGGSAASLFDYAIIDVGGVETLRLTAVPEPSAVALLIAVGIGFVVIRRRVLGVARI